jgi:rubredoxin
MLESGDGESTQIGYANVNSQLCHGTLRVPGSDHMQYAYRLECSHCGYVYGANGADIAERRCPECQQGRPGIRYWLKPVA